MTTSVDTSYGSWPATTPPFISKYGVVTNPSTSFSTGVIPDPYGAPFSLFTNNEQGVWYDPSDFSTMFQDSAGTTPVTAVEQPVGLILDKSKGLVLGSELVVNGDFSNGTTGWTTAGTGVFTVFGGVASFTRNVLGDNTSGQISCTAGKFYKITVTVVAISAASGRVVFNALPVGSVTTGTVIDGASPGTYTAVIPATASTMYLSLASTGNGTPVQYDNISVRELPGNHATQATSTKRPVLSARVNLLTKTEDFSDAAWTKTSVTVTANAATAPDGTLTATRVIASAVSTSHSLSPGIATVIGATYTYAIYAKADLYQFLWVQGLSTYTKTWFDLSSGVISSSGAGLTSSITAVGDGWYKCSFTFIADSPGGAVHLFGVSNASGSFSFLGDGVSGIYIWGASLVPADQASLPYQRINTATDYDTVGFKHYLKFDGIDDALSTGSIDFTATDKMTVVAGVRKLSDAALSAITELSSNLLTGSFLIYTPSPISSGFGYNNKGVTTGSAVVTSGYAAPISAVLTGVGSISTDVCILRVNGTQAASVASEQGTGNYGNYPLYIGSRGGTSLPFNGHLYSLIVRGAQSTDAQIVSAETYVNSKTGIVIP